MGQQCLDGGQGQRWLGPQARKLGVRRGIEFCLKIQIRLKAGIIEGGGGPQPGRAVLRRQGVHAFYARV